MKSLLRISFLVVVAVAIAFFAQQATAASGDIVKISELSAWGYQNGGITSSWPIRDGFIRVKFDVLSTYSSDHFSPEGHVEKMGYPDGSGFQVWAYRIKGSYNLKVAQGEKYYQESGTTRFPMVIKEDFQNLWIRDTQLRQVFFNVEVRSYEAASFILSGEYYIEARSAHCPGSDLISCQWAPWQRIFARQIAEQREWFTNAEIYQPFLFGGPEWRLEREAGVPVLTPAPTPKG